MQAPLNPDTLRRACDDFHVRGYREEGTTTTPFDRVGLNDLDRYQLELDAIGRIPRLAKCRRHAHDMRRASSATSGTALNTATTCPRCATGVGRNNVGRIKGHCLALQPCSRVLA